MRVPVRVLAVLTIGLIMASCGGESPWEQNSGRSSHVEAIQNASNPDHYIDSYNEEWKRRETPGADDCDSAREAAHSHLRLLIETMNAIDAGETTNAFDVPLLAQQDRFSAWVLADSEWMQQNYCP
jgi:hypothetical protein